MLNMRNRRRLCFFCCSSLFLISTWAVFISLDRINRNSSTSSSKFDSRRTLLLIVIASSAHHVSKRETIRNTWLKFNSSLCKYFFLVGGKDLKNDEVTLLAESAKYQDILLLPSVSDAYEALTEKVLRAFVHVESQLEFKFLLKCDDDTFVRLPSIIDELRNRFTRVRNLYWGFFNGNAKVKKKGRWKETKWILCDRYLPYALGGGYILSFSMVQFIATNYHYFNIYQTEDVSVGTWLAPVNVTRIHDPRFDTEYVSRGCFNSYLVTHKRSEADMLFLYNNIVNTGKLCDPEVKLRTSYLYNWDVEPSKCCIRSNSSIP